MLYVHVSSTIRRSSSRLYFCTTAPPGDPACILCQFTITPKVEIKSKSEQKTSIFITCHNHLFGIIPRKSILTKKIFKSTNWCNYFSWPFYCCLDARSTIFSFCFMIGGLLISLACLETKSDTFLMFDIHHYNENGTKPTTDLIKM